MGDNYLKQQAKNFKKRRDLSIAHNHFPVLFNRPEILNTHYLLIPKDGNTFHKDEVLLLKPKKSSNEIDVLRNYEKVGIIHGDGAVCLQKDLNDPNSIGMVQIKVETEPLISGCAKGMIFLGVGQ